MIEDRPWGKLGRVLVCPWVIPIWLELLLSWAGVNWFQGWEPDFYSRFECCHKLAIVMNHVWLIHLVLLFIERICFVSSGGKVYSIFISKDIFKDKTLVIVSELGIRMLKYCMSSVMRLECCFWLEENVFPCVTGWTVWVWKILEPGCDLYGIWNC